jgi:hypothetical protein
VKNSWFASGPERTVMRSPKICIEKISPNCAKGEEKKKITVNLEKCTTGPRAAGEIQLAHFGARGVKTEGTYFLVGISQQFYGISTELSCNAKPRNSVRNRGWEVGM